MYVDVISCKEDLSKVEETNIHISAAKSVRGMSGCILTMRDETLSKIDLLMIFSISSPERGACFS